MTKNEVLDFIRQNPICSFATAEGEQPRVRGFATIVEGGRLYFTTGAMKRVWRQLEANPKVELCYLAPGYTLMLRIEGAIEAVDDRDMKQRLIEERDYLRDMDAKADDPWFKLLRLKHGRARFWSMKDNMMEDAAEAVDM